MTKKIRFSTATNIAGSRREEVLEVEIPDEFTQDQIDEQLGELLIDWVMQNTNSYYEEV